MLWKLKQVIIFMNDAWTSSIIYNQYHIRGKSYILATKQFGLREQSMNRVIQSHDLAIILCSMKQSTSLTSSSHFVAV